MHSLCYRGVERGDGRFTRRVHFGDLAKKKKKKKMGVSSSSSLKPLKTYLWILYFSITAKT